MDQVEYLAPDIVNGLNLYAYCLNNPVMGYDPDGTWLHVLIGAAVGAVVGFAGQIIADAVSSIETGKVQLSGWESYVGTTIGGAFGGAVLSTTGNANVAGAITGFMTTSTTMILTNTSGKTNYSTFDIFATSVVDAAVCAALSNITIGSTGQTKVLPNYAMKSTVSSTINKNIIDGLSVDIFYGTKAPIYDEVLGFFKNGLLNDIMG